jgi:uncharacterized protein YkwD
MKPVIYFAALLFFVLTSLSSFSPPASGGLAGDVLIQTNKLRKTKGLPELVMNEGLNVIAQKHSADMARGRTRFGHDGFRGRQKQAIKKIPSLRTFAENVAYGPTTAKEVVTMWKNSSGHRKNMLGKFRYTGIGIARDRNGRVYYTQVFAY